MQDRSGTHIQVPTTVGAVLKADKSKVWRFFEYKGILTQPAMHHPPLGHRCGFVLSGHPDHPPLDPGPRTVCPYFVGVPELFVVSPKQTRARNAIALRLVRPEGDGGGGRTHMEPG